MRLISQDSLIDVPYEEIGLSVGNLADKSKFYIYANSINGYSNNNMAIYDSVEKALKVMEMVRNAYTGSSLTVFKDYSMEETKELMELMKKSNAVILESGNKQPEFHHCVRNTVFQFPADEDVTI